VNEFNWTYRLPASIAELGKDDVFAGGVKELSAIKAAPKKKARVAGNFFI
jgi:hypothetical protein